ncbi:hypothetical protein EST38_g952 [Candolleomyces aberdarensis]|uniref:Cytoskeletal adapter protein sagA n=1 Tax=Candolleomyces aberdarensis TaxID=2316362 RepID=A0A4Q2DXC4_9AGAR|nr:hypothetical protein EST38_g952 [Candolleomyces aberdarensis]
MTFTPTQAETTLVHQVFQYADPQKLGVVTGEAAVKIFDGSKLSPAVLAEIWGLADDENNGWLSKKGVAKAVRLIGWAQQGRKLSVELLDKPGPLAKIEGINSVAQQNTGMSLPKSPLPLFPVLTQQDREKYTNIFNRAGPVNGLLSGEKARDIFLKSRLPNDQLLQVWTLADTQDRGALDSTDFAIAMYFVHGLMSKTISFIPTSLPPGLLQQAGGGVASHLSGNSGSFSPVHSTFSIQPQSTGQRSQVLQPNHTGMSSASGHRPAPALPARPAAVNSPFRPPPAVPAWDVTPSDKAKFDAWFDGLDTQKHGFIEGDIAVPFMLQSQLAGEILATVWDLGDINNDGRLTRDGFAVAMHLIEKKLAGGEIPAQLPPSLIPPSMRGQAAQRQPPQPEPVQDLFSFDDTPPSSAVAPQQTGGFATLQSQPTGTHSTLSAQPSGTRSPLNDPFAQSIAPTYTGSRNFLDDDEPSTTAASPPLQDKSAEIGNAKNQLDSTTRSLNTAKSERAALEETLASQASQLSSLQTQLSSAKAAYETEIKLLSTLKDRYSTQQADIQKTREELIRAESDLSALKVEKAEIEGSFLRDKEDARELHRRMIEAGQQAETIKSEVEKVKKDAKQQKGLLAIAKKQLSSKEAEKAKAEKELEEASAEIAAITTEQDEVDAALAALKTAPPTLSPVSAPAERVGSADSLAFAASYPLPVTPDLASPVASIKSNNPFERLKTGNVTPRSQSPFAAFSSPPIPQQPEATISFDEDLFSTTSPSEEKAEALSAEGLAYDSPEPKTTAGLDVTSTLDVPREEPSSPATINESELFHTPPTSARALSPAVEVDRYPAIDDFTSHFAPAPVAETKEKKEQEQSTSNSDFDSAFNIDTQAKELDVDESDSSDDEDEVPLSQVKQNVNAAQDKGKAPMKESETTSSFDDVFGAPSTPKAILEAIVAEKPESQPSASTFDDIFGGPLPTSQTNGTASAQESKGNGTATGFNPDPFPPVGATASAPVAGVDAFDEALGKLSPTASTAPQQISFDSAFDDNFDFAAAKAEDAPAPPPANQDTVATTFEDIFGGPVWNGSAPTQQPQVEARSAESQARAAAFDDAFSTLATSTAPQPVVKPEVPAPAPPPVVPPPQNGVSTNPFPTVSAQNSPKAVSPRPSNARPSSPLQERVAPGRSASPKPRLSSSSSKDGTEKPAKEPPARHSKISLRLPFGRKKKDKQQPPEPVPRLPSSHLSPPLEEAERVLTPAVDDDVEAVKQLTSMGFSRTQAVTALEKHGYDMPRALNSLLGTA